MEFEVAIGNLVLHHQSRSYEADLDDTPRVQPYQGHFGRGWKVYEQGTITYYVRPPEWSDDIS